MTTIPDTNTLEDRIKAFLEKEAHAGFSPTQIGLEMGFEKKDASPRVNRILKKLVAEGWAYRMEYDDKPKVVYGKEKR